MEAVSAPGASVDVGDMERVCKASSTPSEHREKDYPVAAEEEVESASVTENSNSVEEEADMALDSVRSSSSTPSEATASTGRDSSSPATMMNGMKVVKLSIPGLELSVEDESFVCPNDSSSDEEDLVYPDNTQDTSDSDYCLPSSESDEDYNDEDYQPPLASVRRPSSAPKPTHRKAAQQSAPGLSHRRPGPAATPPTTPRKTGRSSLGTSPATKRGKSRLASTESEEEDRWHDREEECIKPDPLRFTPARIPGPTFDTTSAWSPLSLFQLFFSTTVVRKIIKNTNANAVKRKQAGMKFKWEVLTMKDFYIFLSIIVFTGLVTVHHRSDYWRKKWPYNFQFPGDSMTRERFEAIFWSLHLSDPKEDEENDKKKNTAEYDRLFKIKPLYTQMVNACKAHFQPHQNLSIDERMVASKARISFKQYMKDKPTKWGYKLFVLADSSIGYTWNFFVYSGKSKSTTGHGLSYSSVMDLMPFRHLGSGYMLYTDNYYTSPALYNDLSKKNIGCCGTIRTNQLGFLKTQTNALPKKAERGDMRWIKSGKLLFVKWMDSREVTMCSTVHQAYSGQMVTRKVKEAGVWDTKSIPVPDSIVDYNHSMGGVDLSDALIGSYTVHHKTMKWYKTFFYHFMDIAVVNSFLLHKELFKLRQDPTQTKPYTHKTFREQLAKEMLEFGGGSADTELSKPPSTTCMPMFLEHDCRKYCKRCSDAGMSRVKTMTYCRKCTVPLCLTSKKNCFQLWHDGK